MSEMKVGDIGVLQNLNVSQAYAGMVVKVLELTVAGQYVDTVSGYSPVKDGGYVVYLPTVGRFAIKKHQIRPISNPDAEQETEQQQELIA